MWIDSAPLRKEKPFPFCLHERRLENLTFFNPTAHKQKIKEAPSHSYCREDGWKIEIILYHKNERRKLREMKHA